ncbi:MAG: hypothetical protein ACI4Q3_10995 [Kiritimatiellia bacterium]
MKKTVKIVLWTLVALVAFLVLSVAALPLWIGPVVTAVASSVVPGMTGTDFTMESFSLNPYNGRICVKGVRLANPQGYDEPVAVGVDSISICLETGSLFSEKIHVYDLTVDSPFVSYVFDAAGTNNFARIAAHAAARSEPKAETAGSGEKTDGKKVLIDRLEVRGTVVQYRRLKLPVPTLVLKDIGKEREGASLTQVGEEVWNSVKGRFGSVGDALNSTAGTVGENAASLLKGMTDKVKTAGEGAKGLLGGDKEREGASLIQVGEKVLNNVKDRFGSVGDALNSTAGTVGGNAASLLKGVKDKVKAAGEGAKGLLGGDRK